MSGILILVPFLFQLNLSKERAETGRSKKNYVMK